MVIDTCGPINGERISSFTLLTDNLNADALRGSSFLRVCGAQIILREFQHFGLPEGKLY